MTGYELKDWDWYPAGQDNMWKVLELTDVSPAGGSSSVSSAKVSPFVYSEGCATFFLVSLLNDTHCMIIG